VIYISGPLTGLADLDEFRAFYEAIGNQGERYGFVVFVPHKHSDPIMNREMTAQQVYYQDYTQVSQAGLMIAYVGRKSHGVGQEIEIAREHGIPVILLSETDCVISRMTLGNPTIWKHLLAPDLKSLVDVLEEFLLQVGLYQTLN
jgi:nucleoside 2-deoxyribosyltransferase